MRAVTNAEVEPKTTNHRGLAPLLAFAAGYVDATSFLALGGLFVAQATGSLVVAGSAFETGAVDILKVAAIPTFVLAGIVTSFMVRGFGAQRNEALIAALLIEAALIVGFAGTASLVPDTPLLPGLLGLCAMGVQGAYARLLLGASSTNVMTSNLTQFSIDLEETFHGYVHRRAYGASLSAARRVGILILGFATGVAIGSLGFYVVGTAGIAIVAVMLALVALGIQWRVLVASA